MGLAIAIEIGIHDILVFSVRPRIMTIWSHKIHRDFILIGLVNKDKVESQSNFVPCILTKIEQRLLTKASVQDLYFI